MPLRLVFDSAHEAINDLLDFARLERLFFSELTGLIGIDALEAAFVVGKLIGEG